MCIRNFCKSSSIAYLAIIFFLTFNAATVNAQSQGSAVTGYGNASYNVGQAGKFMKTWLIAGPVAVNKNSATPDNDTQEKVFKTDSLNPLHNNRLKSADAGKDQ
jgi:hypothetical protein